MTYPRSLGFSKAELLLSMGLIGIIAVISVPLLLNTGNMDTTPRQNGEVILDALQKSLNSYQAESGLIPRTLSPAQVIQRNVNGVRAGSITLASNLPAGCEQVAVPASRILHQNKEWEIIISNQWTFRSNRQLDDSKMCAHNLQHTDISLVRQIYRSGDEGQLLAFSNGSNNGTQQTETPHGNGSTVTSMVTSDSPTQMVTPDDEVTLPPAPPPPPALPNLPKLVWASREKSHAFGHRNRLWRAAEYFGNFFNPGFHLSGGYSMVHLFTPEMKLVQKIRINDMIPDMKVTMKNISPEELERVNWSKGTKDLTYIEAHELGTKLGLPNCVPTDRTEYMLNCVMAKEVVKDAQGNKLKNPDGSYQTTGNAEQINWKGNNLTAGISGVSPVKISLAGKNAIPSGRDGFDFDVDGFTNDNVPVFKTTGGLEPDEAWLAFDREGNGFFNKDRVLDGNDIFGDHLHRYPSGYEDLAATFKNDIRVDKNRQRFIEVQELAWWESFWIWLSRLFGFNTNPIASYDLQLIKSTNDVVPASTVIRRIYVDYNDVEEYDESGNNAIFQRSLVEYKTGQSAWSGDQWFKPVGVVIITPSKGAASQGQ